MTDMQAEPSSSTAPVLNVEGIRTLADVAKCVDALCYQVSDLILSHREGRRPAEGVLELARVTVEHAGVLSTALAHAGAKSVPSTLATVVKLRRRTESAEKLLARAVKVLGSFEARVLPWDDDAEVIALAIEAKDVARLARERGA